jgi:hypothetical protein
MSKGTNSSKHSLVFVYNADSGLFNTLSDISHKIFSPETYQCHLCALTHSTFGMHKGWKQFLETLDRPVELLHADELKKHHNVSNIPLPAIFIKEDAGLKLWIEAGEINSCRTIDDLKHLIRKRLLLV